MVGRRKALALALGLVQGTAGAALAAAPLADVASEPAGRTADVTRLNLGPRAPPPGQLAGMVSTIGLSAAAYTYWDKIIVPQKRTEIARSKRTGEIKEYLEEIRDDDDRKAEQWLLADWLEPNTKKDRAIPFLPAKKFNSGDNPVIAAAAFILLTGVASGAVEQLKGMAGSMR